MRARRFIVQYADELIVYAPLTWLLICYVFLSDRTSVGEYFTVWPPLVWSLVASPLILLRLAGRRRRRWYPALVMAVVLAAIDGEWRSLLRAEAPHAHELRAADDTTTSSPNPLRLVSFNVAGAGWERVSEEFRAVRADIMALQESPSAIAATNLPSGLHCYDAGDCALLSRLPLRNVPVRTLTAGALQCRAIDLPLSRTVIIANVHLMLPSLVMNITLFSEVERLIRDHRTRVVQYRELAEALKQAMAREKTASLILVGDFNTRAGAWSLRPLRQIASDSWPRSGAGWGGTFPVEIPLSRIDQCWITPDIRMLSSVVRRAPFSDHRALVVHLETP